MSRLFARRPSPSLIVSIIALAVAMSGSAVAATTLTAHPSGAAKAGHRTRHRNRHSALTKGDKLIAKASLSGDRLRRHTLTGTQINLKKLGTVPRAKAANTARTAVNATKLGGEPASYYEDAAGRTGTKGIITATGTPTGTTVPLFTTGPFTVSMTCVTTAAGTGLNLTATSTIAGSDLNGTLNVPAATPIDLGPTVDIAATGAPATADDATMDFEAPGGGQAIVSGATGVNSLGVGCWANFAGIA